MTQVTDAARTALHNRVRDVLGEREGDTLMAHLPPVGWADVATKQDVAVLDERIDNLSGRIDNLGERIDNLAGRIANEGQRIDNLAERIDGMVTKGEFERGMRRQTVWMASLVVGQSGVYMAITFWFAQRVLT